MNRLPFVLLPLALIGTCSAQSIKAASLIGAPMSTLKQTLGAPVAQPRYSHFTLFRPAGFDQVLVDKPGPQMKQIAFTFSHLLAGRVAVSELGLVSKGTTIKVMKDVSGPDGLTRNFTEFVGVGGLPSERSKGLWRMFYQEVGVLNKKKLDSIASRIKTLPGSVRQNLVRSCYDWHSELMLFAPSAVPSNFIKRM